MKVFVWVCRRCNHIINTGRQVCPYCRDHGELTEVFNVGT